LALYDSIAAWARLWMACWPLTTLKLFSAMVVRFLLS
jgi:hypothetical protein